MLSSENLDLNALIFDNNFEYQVYETKGINDIKKDPHHEEFNYKGEAIRELTYFRKKII